MEIKRELVMSGMERRGEGERCDEKNPILKMYQILGLGGRGEKMRGLNNFTLFTDGSFCVREKTKTENKQNIDETIERSSQNVMLLLLCFVEYVLPFSYSPSDTFQLCSVLFPFPLIFQLWFLLCLG